MVWGFICKRITQTVRPLVENMGIEPIAVCVQGKPAYPEHSPNANDLAPCAARSRTRQLRDSNPASHQSPTQGAILLMVGAASRDRTAFSGVSSQCENHLHQSCKFQGRGPGSPPKAPQDFLHQQTIWRPVLHLQQENSGSTFRCVPPANQFPFAPKWSLAFLGAAYGNRTRLYALATHCNLDQYTNAALVWSG